MFPEPFASSLLSRRSASGAGSTRSVHAPLDEGSERAGRGRQGGDTRQAWCWHALLGIVFWAQGGRSALPLRGTPPLGG